MLESIERCGQAFGGEVRRVFLADGDAMTLSTRRLVTVLEAIRREMPAVRRVSSYCLPRNLRNKTAEELKELAALGLSFVYVGVESGDDEVLARVNKGETFASALDALQKLGEAGIKRSVMILNGLGGQALWQQHAANSAALMNAAQPEYLATLGGELPQGRGAAARQISRLGAAQRAGPDAGDGGVPLRAGAETDRVPQRPRLELAGPQGHARGGQAAPAGAIARGHRLAGDRAAAPRLGAWALMQGPAGEAHALLGNCSRRVVPRRRIGANLGWRIEPRESPLTLSLSPWERERRCTLRA